MAYTAGAACCCGLLAVHLSLRRRAARQAAVREFWRSCDSGAKFTWKEGRVRWRDSDETEATVVSSAGLRYVRPYLRWELHRIVFPPPPPPPKQPLPQQRKGRSTCAAAPAPASPPTPAPAPCLALCEALARQYPCGTPRRFDGSMREFWAYMVRAGRVMLPAPGLLTALGSSQDDLLGSWPRRRVEADHPVRDGDLVLLQRHQHETATLAVASPAAATATARTATCSEHGGVGRPPAATATADTANAPAGASATAATAVAADRSRNKRSGPPSGSEGGRPEPPEPPPCVILRDDDRLCVVAKPAGIPCVGNSRHNNLLSMLQRRQPPGVLLRSVRAPAACAAPAALGRVRCVRYVRCVGPLRASASGWGPGGHPSGFAVPRAGEAADTLLDVRSADSNLLSCAAWRACCHRPVHRIDKLTSGVWVLSKTARDARRLQKLISGAIRCSASAPRQRLIIINRCSVRERSMFHAFQQFRVPARKRRRLAIRPVICVSV